MSTQYPGGFITKSPVAPTTTAASGIWTVDQALQYVKAGTWPSPPIFIEDIFSTYLYTGNGSTQAINNGIDVSGQGGMVWVKDRGRASTGHALASTASAATNWLGSNITNVYQTFPRFSAFNSNGFTVDSGSNSYFPTNYLNDTYVSWTFRKQPKFFDIVTYTGNGSVRTIPHNLQSVPGCIMVKRVSGGASDWYVQHRSLGPTYDIFLNSTSAALGSSNAWNSTAPTSTVFSLGLDSNVNSNGDSFIAYLFAHNAGGFGLTGTDNVISCGSYTGNGTTQAINLGYEVQFLLTKMTNNTGSESAIQQSWRVVDIMRGMPVEQDNRLLLANTTDAEQGSIDSYCYQPSSTGFVVNSQANQSGKTFIYIAIRRGPMKTPTVGTSVFSPIAANVPTGTAQTINFVPDMQLLHYRDGADAVNNTLVDRLRGVSTNATSGGLNLKTSNVSAEGASSPGATLFWNNTGFQVSGYLSNINSLFYSFGRAPGFFDEVCYTGTGAAGATAITHNLGVVPQMIIVKSRNTAGYAWGVYQSSMAVTDVVYLESTQAKDTGMITWGSTTPTSAQFYVGNTFTTNGSGVTYVAYLFATLAGVSKVGSYTGTAALQTVNCGFTSGARFVLIKRTDSTGDWYVWDSARGISSGADPYYLVNTNAADVTGTNYVDTDTTGFKVTAAAPAGLNAVGGNYIFLAIA